MKALELNNKINDEWTSVTDFIHPTPCEVIWNTFVEMYPKPQDFDHYTLEIL